MLFFFLKIFLYYKYLTPYKFYLYGVKYFNYNPVRKVK